MRIGIDFDNTIACYDGVFHAAAVERGIIPPTTPADKTSVRDHLRSVGREDDWTELQGHVYGARMELVALYPGVRAFIARAAAEGHGVLIISHKTRHPYLGPRYDLHAAARAFLKSRELLVAAGGSALLEAAFFELTLADKLDRIASERCDVFVDDLPELLAQPGFPASTRAVLFDPEAHYPGGVYNGRTYEVYQGWTQITAALLGRQAS